MKILITNTVTLNGGDAAILLSIIDLLRRKFGKDTEFIVYDSQPEIASRYYPDLKFRKLLYQHATELPTMKNLGQSFFGRALRYGLRAALRIGSQISLYRLYLAAWCQAHQLAPIAQFFLDQHELQDINHYASADLIVSTGGTYLVEKYPLKSRIFDFKLSLALKKPLVLYTQSLGPFVDSNNRKEFRQIFDRALLVLLRDEASLKHVQDLGVHGNNLCVSSDVVFSLQNQTALAPDSSDPQLSHSRPKIIISVRYWHLFESISPEVGIQAYRTALCALTEHLVRKYHAQVTFLSTCQGIPEYWTDDSKFAKEIFDLLPSDIQKHVEVNREFHTPQALLDLLSACDMVIATRMHMCILSLVAGTPVLPIAYEFKTKELFNRLGMGQWVHDIETINGQNLVISTDNFLEVLPEIKKSLVKEVEKEQQRALESGTLVKQLCEQRQTSSVLE